MNFIPIIFIPAIIGLIVFTIAFFKHPRWAIAGLIVIKPIVDITWNYSVIFDINFLRIYAGVFAIIGLVYIFWQRNKIWQCPLSYAWIAFLVFNVISIFFILDWFLLDKVSYFLRILNGFVMMMLFFTVFDFNHDKKFVITIFIISALIPIILWITQIFSTFPNTTVAGISNELTRIKGPYEDFFSYVFYALQALICSYALFAITKGTHKTVSFFTRFVLAFLILLSIIIIYKSYTKVGWLVVPVVSMLWFALRKRFVPALIVAILTVTFFSINPFRDEAGSLFRKEIDVLILKNKKWDTDTLFMGRVRDWKGGMDKFGKQPVLNKLFGASTQLGNPENDYFRILWHNGILGFFAFLFLIGQTLYILFRRFFLYKDPLFLTALLALVTYLLIAIGFYPMFYPAMQWFVWGMVGFVLSGQKARKDSCGIDKNNGIVINRTESSTVK